MTPTLSAYLLALPLPVRLALLDADPNGAGWYVGSYDVDVYNSPERYGKNELLHTIRGGSAWLPCNPLAIVEHAKGMIPTATQAMMGREQGTHEWVVFVEVWRNTPGWATYAHKARGPCPYTAAIKLLEEVVRE